MRKEIVGNDKVFIGRLADTDVREFAFDLSEYTSCMDGEFSVSCLFVLPSKSDSEAYAIAIDHYRLEGNQLIWIPTNAECSETGWGKFEAILYNEGQQIASLIWRVQVGKSLAGDEEPPEGWENYILAVERLVNRIEDMTATASVDNTTGTPSVTVTKTENPLNLDFAFHNIKGAKGNKGDTGSKGETGNGIVSIVKTGTSGLVDTYTITYDNGDTDTFTVTNGEKGDKGDTGNTGATPDIYTTAVTLAEGSSAYAHVSGTIEQPLITFGIPKGDTGSQGPKGDGWTQAQSDKLAALPSLAGTDGKFIIEQGQGQMALSPFKYTYMFTGDVVYNMTSGQFSVTLIDGSYTTFMTMVSLGEVDYALFFANIYVDVDGDNTGDMMVGYMLFNLTGAATNLNFTTLFDGRDLGFAQVCYVQLDIDSNDNCVVSVRNLAQQPATITVSTASVSLTPSADYESIHYILTNNAITDITISDMSGNPCSQFDIVFTTGSTAPTLSASWITFPDGTTPTLDANTRYEINVKDGYAVVASWT